MTASLRVRVVIDATGWSRSQAETARAPPAGDDRAAARLRPSSLRDEGQAAQWPDRFRRANRAYAGRGEVLELSFPFVLRADSDGGAHSQAA